MVLPIFSIVSFLFGSVHRGHLDIRP